MRKVSKKAFFKEIISSERGDTNFISIIIVLAIIAIVGAMFYGIVKTYMPQLLTQVTDFFDNLLG